MLSLLDPTQAPVLVVAAVFVASLLQSVTGIGFGVIAGPVLLITTGSATAIQASILLSLLIACLLAPQTLPRIDRSLLWHLTVGLSLGTPVGAFAAAVLSVDGLKVVAAVVVGAMTLIATGILSRYPLVERDSVPRRWVAGGLAGALNTALAMPGPPIAAYATAIRSGKDAVRSTTLAAFLIAYPIALAAQAAVMGLSHDLAATTLPLVLPTVAGSILGSVVARRVDEGTFRWLTTAFLLASTLGLILL